MSDLISGDKYLLKTGEFFEFRYVSNYENGILFGLIQGDNKRDAYVNFHDISTDNSIVNNNVIKKLAAPLTAICNCYILKQESVDILASLNVELADNWNKRQVFRTQTEMLVSVLNDGKHPDNASKYWQSVREQAVMLDNLAIVSFDYRRNEVALKRHQKRLLESKDELDREEIQIDIDECYFKKASMEQSANDRVREIKLWSNFKAELDDGTFNTKNVDVNQLTSLHQILINRKNCLTQNSSQAEVINVLGPLSTIERMIGDLQ